MLVTLHNMLVTEPKNETKNKTKQNKKNLMFAQMQTIFYWIEQNGRSNLHTISMLIAAIGMKQIKSRENEAEKNNRNPIQT